MPDNKAYLVPSGKPIEELVGRNYVRKEPMALIHRCYKEGCANDAPFGFDVDVRHGKWGWWSCRDHYAEATESFTRSRQAG